jgi:hypothetical protein
VKGWHATASDPDQRRTVALPNDADAGQKVKPASARRTQQAELADQGAPLLFAREDWSLYVSLATLPQRAGVAAAMLPRLVVKEFTDNALDAADAADRPGAVEIGVDSEGNLLVADHGTGIPGATPEQIGHLFCVARPMLSSKLLRRPTRGAVGNGLRVCLGFLTATRGQLIVETGSLRVVLVPEIDGTSRIVSIETIDPRPGMRLIAIAGDVRFLTEHLAWAEDAIELARQSGEPAFTGRPSAHWLDLDHFRVLLRSAVGNVSVRQFLGELDGCAGSRAQSRIAARFLRRSAADLDADEAAELLVLAQRETRPPRPKALHPLGRDAVITNGYALAEGMFTSGEHAPRAGIPFLVECWIDALFPEEQSASLTSTLYMNRTRALAPCTGETWFGRLDLSISGTALRVPAPAGPHYCVTINITAPMFPMTSDGETPDCRPFRVALIEAVGKAAKQAGRDIAAQMSADQKRADTHRQRQEREDAEAQRIADREERQRRLAWLAKQKAEWKATPKIRHVVIKLLPGAVEIEAASGYMFNTRRLVYRIHDEVMRRTHRELTQNYFDRLLTEIEAEQGDLHPLLIREARGNYSIPHLPDDAIPLGTQSVRSFRRPPWTFNKIIAIEKEDLRLMLRQARWDLRHDAFLTSAKGFNTRAARDVIDKIAETIEPVRVFSVHDGDWAGTLIQHTLQNATLARGARKIEIIDVGVQPWEGIALGLSIEKVPVEFNKDGTSKRRAVGDYVRARTDRAPNGETWEEWLQRSRVELNAFTSAELIDWLDRKMAEHDAGKLIPPDNLLEDQFSERVRERAHQSVMAAIDRCLKVQIAAIEAEEVDATKEIRTEIDRITADLRLRLAEISGPFERRIEAARSGANAIGREAAVHQVIKRMTPDTDSLRAAIGAALSNEATLHWSTVLDEIADGTEVGDIDAGGAA